MKQMEVISVTVHSPAYMTTKEGKTFPYVALELLGRESGGTQTTTLYAFSPDMVTNLVSSLAQALTHIHGLPPESPAKH